jgi:NACHT domain
MGSVESLPPSPRQRSAGGRARGGRFRRRLRRLQSLLYQPNARLRKRRRAHPGAPPRIDKKRHWRGSNPLKRGVRVLVYGGGLLLLAALALAVIAAIRHRSFAFDNRCQQRALSCTVLASFLVPLLTIALVSALFLLGRLWYLRRRYLRAARSRPQDVVPTAGSIIGDVVGRDELCRVMIADMRDAQTRRPHVVVGGIGTGKTALLVRMTKLLAHQRAVPVAIRLRDAQKSLDFRELARAKFITDLQPSILSDAEGEKVWRQLLKESRIVVLADGLEEALINPRAEAERDNLIRLAIRQANKDGLPLLIASRPHNPLRGTEAALVELEPLSEEAALDYIQRKNPIEDEQRIDWIVETADVTEAPLYLQIARQLHRAGLLVYVSGNPNDHQLDTRGVDRAELRLRLLETWKQAIVNGHFPPGLALSREDRVAAIEQLSVLACIGLRHDTLQVELDEFEALLRLSKEKEKRDKPGVPIIAEAHRRLGAVGHPFDIRLAATWGTQLQLVEAQENAVRFPHSILQAYLGSRLIGYAMIDGKFRKEALKNSGRELLIALVMHSRAEQKQRSARQPADLDAAAFVPAGPIAAEARMTARDQPALGATWTDPASVTTSGPDPAEPIGAERTGPERAAATSAGPDVGGSGVQAGATDLRMLLRHAAGKRTDAKALDLYATALEMDSVNPAPQHQDIAREILATWQNQAERDPRTVQHAQLNLVRRFGEAARTITLRRSGTGSWVSRRTEPGPDTATPGLGSPAYRQLFDISCAEPYYPVRLAAAQEIGAGGDDALAELGHRLELRLPTGEQARIEGNGQGQVADGQQQHSVAGAEQREQQGQDKEEDEEKTQRQNIMRAWLAPLLVGSAVTDSSQRAAQDFLKKSLDFVHRQNQQPDRERSGLSVEVALAQGFKYAANRRREHPQARSEARAYLTDQAKEMLNACSFWFTRLTLIQALTLWRLPDGENRPDQQVADYKKLVADWSGMDGRRRRDRHHEHPFVVEAARLAVRALETGQPERYMWIDESGVVSRVGSSPAKPHSRRKHNLWIPPSTGWTALNPRAQQLVADVLLLLNLAERGRPPDRERRLQRTNKNYLPPCLAEDRSPLDPARPLGTAGDFDPGSRCATGCKFSLCPYPARGEQSYRQELSEAFCRRQQRLLAPRAIRTRAASWYEGSVTQLRRFWKELGQPVTSAEVEPDDTGRTRVRDRRRESRGGAKRSA